MEFNYEKFQKITPTHLDQYTEGQTLIQRTDYGKGTIKSRLDKEKWHA